MLTRSSSSFPEPPDQDQRLIALDPLRSLLVQAPAGSGKTDLLTRRFLRLLAEVNDPKQIVAITFTKAAAAEMRNRILDDLEKAARRSSEVHSLHEWSMETLAERALAHSQKLNWRLIDLSSQLRISTIDSFCRDLAIQQPIYSGIGNSLQISERPADLYRLAARSTLEKLGNSRYPELSAAISDLLLWRDNNWRELENLIVKMLSQRDRWMLDFVLSQSKDWDLLRERLEAPMAREVRMALERLELLLSTEDRAEAHDLARFACTHSAGDRYRGLAELADFPSGPHDSSEALEEARGAFLCLGSLLLKNDGAIRRKIDSRLGFPKEHLDEKLRMEDLLERLAEVPDLEDALADLRKLPPARYSDDDWQILRAIFVALRHAAGELKAIFAEAGTVDFIEVAQLAKQVLRGEDNLPSDAAQAIADDIHHLLIDEFQDTSRRQHEFVTALIEAWPDPADRTVFVVGDPMQSIYFFRDAESELFRRVKDFGFELKEGESFPLDPVALSANFRTDPALVEDLNHVFEDVFASPDGSGVEFARADAARPQAVSEKRLNLHLAFTPQSKGNHSENADAVRRRQELIQQRETARSSQIAEIIALISSHLDRARSAQTEGRKYRIAVLGRARTALAPIALALREAGIPFRAVELEGLHDRPEILDAVSLTRAVFNPEDRAAWLGVLRAPWCGLRLEELHTVAGTDDVNRFPAPIPQSLQEKLDLLSPETRHSAERILAAYNSIAHLRSFLPIASPGTLVQQVWRAMGGDSCVDEASRANLDLYWKLLDSLPNGEQDLVGPALDAALENLCALPDPAASGTHGVQLMTIHKSKGLEFEVVIVPDLQAQGGRGSVELLSWLERGLPEPGERGELTEFLIAPLQFKGEDPGAAKGWVDRARRAREAQEMRRILYVAATRAREELHLFAQPAYKIEADGTRKLAEPSNCLLSTAWPALGDEINRRFDEWNAGTQPSPASGFELTLDTLVASEGKLLFMPSAAKPTMIRRLPPEFNAPSPTFNAQTPATPIIGLSEAEGYTRHEGGLHSRALGNAVHKLLEHLSRLRITLDWDSCRAALEKNRPRIISSIRASGLATGPAEKIANQAFEIVIAATHDRHGQWILSPHSEAASETAWAGLIAGTLHQIRVDRLFRAGSEPLEIGDSALWIIDYKTAHAEDLDASTIPAMRKIFAPQLQSYATILRNLHSASTPIRAGLYYPRMSVFDWWEL